MNLFTGGREGEPDRELLECRQAEAEQRPMLSFALAGKRVHRERPVYRQVEGKLKQRRSRVVCSERLASTSPAFEAGQQRDTLQIGASLLQSWEEHLKPQNTRKDTKSGQIVHGAFHPAGERLRCRPSGFRPVLS
jgi:hypothetical protein